MMALRNIKTNKIFKREDKAAESIIDKNFRKLSSRQKVVASHILRYEFGKHNLANDSDLRAVLEKIAYSNQNHEFDEIIRVITNGVVEDRYFEWLKDDERARLWFWGFFSDNFTIRSDTKIHLYYSIDKKLFDNIVLNMDLLYESSNYINSPYPLHKYNKIRNRDIKLHKNEKEIFMIYSANVFTKNRTGDKYFKWIDEKNSDQLIWTCSYLKNNGYLLDLDFFVANSSAKKMVQIQASIDAIGILKNKDASLDISVEKSLFMDKMRRAWSQKKFRDDGKVKNKYHLPLTKVAKRRLDNMAEVQKSTPTAILHLLINQAYEANYLDEKGKDKY